jgi:hypothetical protein
MHKIEELEDHHKMQVQLIELKVNKKLDLIQQDTLKHSKFSKHKNMETIKKITFKVTSLTILKMNF